MRGLDPIFNQGNMNVRFHITIFVVLTFSCFVQVNICSTHAINKIVRFHISIRKFAQEMVLLSMISKINIVFDNRNHLIFYRVP